MIVLKAYLEEELHIDFSAPGLQQLYSCSHLNGLSELLSNHFVISKDRRNLLSFTPTSDCHKAVVDQCVFFLLSEKRYKNVLTHGYRLGSTTNVNAPLHCVSVNTNVASLKGTPWKLFHEIIGTQSFVNFVVNCVVLRFDGEISTQILGDRLATLDYTGGQANKHGDDLSLPAKTTSFLYKSSFRFKCAKILPPIDECPNLTKEIFYSCSFIRNRKIPCEFENILRKILFNHHNKIRYIKILNSLCPKPRNLTHTSPGTPTTQVIRFLVVLLEKLIPLELYGSKKNKAVIFKHLSSFLRSPITGSLDIGEITKSLKLKDFSWLLPPNKQFTKHDFERANSLLQFSISWLFKSLIPKIIYTFFYCTEISSCVDIIYYRHDVWNKKSLPFLTEYLNRQMIENEVCRNHDSYLLSKFNHNRARVVPKKVEGEFRIIAIPSKGVDLEENIAFKKNLRSVINPVQCILEYLRNSRKTHFEKVYSASQIVGLIKDFKIHLTKKFEHLPKLHFLKFDMDSCFDSIPRKKTLHVVKELLKKERGFFVRSGSLYNSRTGAFSIQNVVNGCRQIGKDELYIDNVKTTFISNEDVITVLESEVFQNVLTFNGKCYLRKDGLFQGASLSALLVDLIYDDLLEYYNMFHPTEEDDTLVLRLADDFLIISTNDARIKLMKEVALQGFEEFSARVNINKIISSEAEEIKQDFSFCALQISIDDLEVKKSPESLSVPNIKMVSATRVHKRLLSLFQMRLSYGTTDLRINSRETVLEQIQLIGSNIAEAYAKACKSRRTAVKPFIIFFRQLNSMVARSCSASSGDTLVAQSRVAIVECFLDVLSPKHAKFKDVIAFLKCDIKSQLGEI